MNTLLRQINATGWLKKMSKKKPLHMRPFPYVYKNGSEIRTPLSF